MNIGEVIRRRRLDRGVGQAWLARKAEISRQALANIELRGATPGSDTLARIARILDCTMDDLLKEAA